MGQPITLATCQTTAGSSDTGEVLLDGADQTRDAVLETLELLHGMRPIKTNACHTWLETKVQSLSKKLTWAGGAMYGAMLAIAASVHVLPEGSMSPEWFYVAGIAFIVATLCALTYLALTVVPSFVMLVFFKEYMFRQRQFEACHDLAHVNELINVDPAILGQADLWLSERIDRIRRRMTLVFGGPEKVAIITLAGIGWLVWKEFPATQEPWIQRGLQFGVCFIAGSAIGAMFSQSELHTLNYQREPAR